MGLRRGAWLGWRRRFLSWNWEVLFTAETQRAPRSFWSDAKAQIGFLGVSAVKISKN